MEENTQRFGEISLKAGTKAEVPFLDLSKIFKTICDFKTRKSHFVWRANWPKDAALAVQFKIHKRIIAASRKRLWGHFPARAKSGGRPEKTNLISNYKYKYK